MEYHFLADFLAKFSSLTPWIQGVITISISAIPVSFFYFLNQTIVKVLEFAAMKRET